MIFALVIFGIVALVVDGDTFEIDGQRIRLYGVDAAEMDTKKGRVQARHLKSLIEGKKVRCEERGRSWGRMVAYCTLEGEDIAAMAVRHGWAGACPRYAQAYYVQFVTAGNMANGAYVSEAGFCR